METGNCAGLLLTSAWNTEADSLSLCGARGENPRPEFRDFSP